MTVNDAQLIKIAASQSESLQAILTRLARMESRLTQLMLFQGMQTDGRSQLNSREMTHVA